MDNFIIGTCDTMCPLNEIKLRSREKLLHFYERKQYSHTYEADESKVVKEFARSAAGIRTPKAWELRTREALEQTIVYLLTDVLMDDRRPYNVAYDFIFDRLRAVRQEMVMQNFNAKVTVRFMEPIVMFLAFSSYRLAEEPIDKFDPKICHQHLQECLKKILSCYDELYDSNGYSPDPSEIRRREFVESIYLLFNLGDFDALSRGLRVPSFIRGSTFNLSLSLALDFWNANLYRCLMKIPKLPHLLCAIASLNIPYIQRQLLLWFATAYQNKALTVPIDWLQKVLLYGNQQQFIVDCKYYRINVDEEAQSVKFSKAEFDHTRTTLKSRREPFVEKLLRDISISDVLLFKEII